VKIVAPILKNCLKVFYERFKQHILCFELNTVKKYDILERGFTMQLEMEATFAL